MVADVIEALCESHDRVRSAPTNCTLRSGVKGGICRLQPTEHPSSHHPSPRSSPHDHIYDVINEKKKKLKELLYFGFWCQISILVQEVTALPHHHHHHQRTWSSMRINKMCGWFLFVTLVSLLRVFLSLWVGLDQWAERQSRLKNTLSQVRAAGVAGGRIFTAGALRGAAATTKRDRTADASADRAPGELKMFESEHIHTRLPSAAD